jgi:hypothetical protein
MHYTPQLANNRLDGTPYCVVTPAGDACPATDIKYNTDKRRAVCGGDYAVTTIAELFPELLTPVDGEICDNAAVIDYATNATGTLSKARGFSDDFFWR